MAHSTVAIVRTSYIVVHHQLLRGQKSHGIDASKSVRETLVREAADAQSRMTNVRTVLKTLSVTFTCGHWLFKIDLTVVMSSLLSSASRRRWSRRRCLAMFLESKIRNT